MTEIDPIALPEAKVDLKIGRSLVRPFEYQNRRVAMSVSLPLSFKGATPPRPDPGHPPTLVGGIVKRFGYKPPKMNREHRRKFRKFVKLWLKRNLQPLTDADVPSFDEWIDKTPYSQSRKDELRRVWGEYSKDPKRYDFHKVKSFVKDETYEAYKYPRAINSRIDQAKCYFGPMVQAVSDRLFKLEWFIKTVPVSDRPKVIRDAMYSPTFDEDYIYTDYTAFEAHFVQEVMSVTQLELFKFMTSKLADTTWYDMYAQTMTGENILTFKNVICKIIATRMSGEMDTSLSNGFSNLMLFLYACHVRGATSVSGFVEGDDGLFRVSPAHCAPTQEDFADLGFTIKIGHTKELSEASFCGQVYDMTDLIVVTDVREVLCRMGWTNKRYTRASNKTLMQLLRAKGYSLVYQYNGCPILSRLGRRILHLTQNVVIEQRIIDAMDLWEKSKLLSSLPEELEPGMATRSLVNKLYNVSIVEQLKIEAWIDTMDLGDHDVPFSVPNDWVDYYQRYRTGKLYDDPCWLLKDERPYLASLKARKCCQKFISSLGVVV